MATKAYIIDPTKKQITAAQIDGHSSIDGILQDFTNTIRLPSGRDILFVADSGFHKPNNKLFVASFYHSPIAGKGVIVGWDADEYGYGSFTDTSLSSREIKSLIAWPNYGIADLRFSFVGPHD